jgi:hypothetical protein
MGAYEAGDLDRFMGLFAADARSKESSSRNGIRSDYRKLFRETQRRRIALVGIAWRQESGHMKGQGSFQVQTWAEGSTAARKSSGSVTLVVQRKGGRPLITGLYHTVRGK